MADQTTQNDRFGVEEKEQWLSYLKENGYVIIKEVASQQQREEAISLFWEKFEEHFGIKRDEPESWKNWDVDRRGISLDVHIMQSLAAWYVRSLPKAKQAFSAIWGEDDLVVSMDSVLMWKPWWVDENWLPETEGLHVDQNPAREPGFECVQGMVPLFDVTPEIGGLEVVPGSHLKSEENGLQTAKYKNYMWNFIPLPKSHPAQGTGKLLLAGAGDLVLWDSRTIHGGLVGSGSSSCPPAGLEDGHRLARLSMTVCMLPRKKASKMVLRKRKEGFEQGKGFNHLPTEARVTASARGPVEYKPIALTEAQAALL